MRRLIPSPARFTRLVFFVGLLVASINFIAVYFYRSPVPTPRGGNVTVQSNAGLLSTRRFTGSKGQQVRVFRESNDVRVGQFSAGLNKTCSAITTNKEGVEVQEIFDPAKINDMSLFHCYPLAVNITRLVQLAKNGTETYIAPLNVYTYKTRLKPTCDPVNETFILYLIKSRPENTRARDAIRSTWGDETLVRGVKIKRVFSIGLSLNMSTYPHLVEEHDLHRDLLMDSYPDSYLSTQVKMTSGLLWATEHCAGAQFLVLADDDVLINPWNMVELLSSAEVKSREKLYLGIMTAGHKPFREPMNRYYVSVEEYPFLLYPPLAPAATIVINRNFAVEYAISWKYISVVRFDDVYLGIVARVLGVEPMHTDLFKVDWSGKGSRALNAKSKRDKLVSCIGEMKPDTIRAVWKKYFKGLGK